MTGDENYGSEVERDPAVSALVWEDEDGQQYKRVWEEGVGPKDSPITAGGRL